MNHAMEQAGQTADRIRDELLRTLEELERRRQRAKDWRAQLRQHRALVLGAAGILLLGVGANIALVVWANRRRARRLPARWRQALPRTTTSPGIPTRVARSLVVSASTHLTANILGRAARRLIG